MRGKIIVLEGIDCCGKETQANLLVEALQKRGFSCVKMSFPDYEAPTGKIIGGPYMGKSTISPSWFLEGVERVDSKVVSLYYAADRLYHLSTIESLLEKGTFIIMDRYVYSNMAFHGGRIVSKSDRYAFYDWIDELEFSFLKLPRADICIFLDLSYEDGYVLRNCRVSLDDIEKNGQFLKYAYHAYQEIALKYDFSVVPCYQNTLLSIEKIHEHVLSIVLNTLENDKE